MLGVWCLCGLFLTVAHPRSALCSRPTQRQIIRPQPRNPDICLFHSALSLRSFRPRCNSVAHVLWVWAIPSWHYTAGLASGPAVRSYPEVLLELHTERRARDYNWLITPSQKYFCLAALHTSMKTKWRKHTVQSWFYSISCTCSINDCPLLLLSGSADNV